MEITSDSFAHQMPIPEEFAFGKKDPVNHFAFSQNRNPPLIWSDLPEGTGSLVLICVDPDVPTDPTNVNKEGAIIPDTMPRVEFHHWVMVDIPPACAGIEAGECSREVTTGGKQNPQNPAGAPTARQGVNDFTNWFAGDETMGGVYRGYDGPAPPWNDERVHTYHFKLYAIDLERCPVEGDFTAPDVLAKIAGHILAEATHTGKYTLNPDLTP